jgi:cysteine dioxygenase
MTDKPLDFKELVEEIKKLQDFNSNVETIKALFARYKSDPKEWEKYFFVEKGCYTRNLVYGTKDFNLMILCWDSKATSPIHDHSNAHCVLKVIKGDLQESLYDWNLSLQKETIFDTDSVSYMHDKLGLHAIHNPTEGPSCSLHLYSPPFDFCKTFDRKTKKARSSGKCVFYSIDGTKNQLVDSTKYDCITARQ